VQALCDSVQFGINNKAGGYLPENPKSALSTIKRIQLTLFLPGDYSQAIEQVRMRYNPAQYALIRSHVTLCREDELLSIDNVRESLRGLRRKPILIPFDLPRRFSDGNGVLIPLKQDSAEFDSLRNAVLAHLTSEPRKHMAHITLMHPRNSTCTDEIFREICKIEFPAQILFSSICLIEQKNNEPWIILDKFDLVD
jgi:2'-5' RNA ligase